MSVGRVSLALSHSVVLPLHAQVFASCCYSTKPAFIEFSIKLMILDYLKNKPNALEMLYTAF
jgi:hypothetical protein